MIISKKTEFLYIATKLLKVICTILPSMVLARAYSKSDYGVFLECQLIVQLISMIASFGLPKSIYYFCGKSDDKKRVIANSFIMLVFFAGSLCVLLYLFDYTIGFKDARISELLLLICLQILFRTPNLASQAIYISLNKVGAGTFVQFIEALLTCSILMLLGYLAFSVTSLMWALIVIDIILIVTLILYLKIPIILKSAYDFSLWKKQLQYSFPIALSITAFMFGRRYDQMLIVSMFNIDEFAVYSRGAIEIPLNNIVTFSLAGLATPIMLNHYNNHDIDSMINTWNTSIEKACKIMIPSFWFLLQMRQDFIECLYSNKYLLSTPIFLIYLFLIPLQVCTFDIVFQVINKTRIIFVASLLNVSINILLSYLFVRYYGMIGAAYGTVISLTITNIFYLILMKHDLKVSFYMIFPWKKFFYYNVLASVVSLFVVFPLHYLDSPFERLVVAATLFTLAYTTVSGDIFRIRGAIESIWPLKKNIS